jgi:hypothetical protein
MSANAQRLTPEQYLEIERAAEFRSEFYNGRMYAMSGGSYGHVLVIGNLAFAVRSALKGVPVRLQRTTCACEYRQGGFTLTQM